MSAVSINCSHCQSVNRINHQQLDDNHHCNKCRHSVLDGGVIELQSHNFLPLSSAKIPLVIFMSGPNCSICKTFSSIFAASSKQHTNKMRFAHAYLPKHKALVSKYKIRGVPAIAIFKRGKLQAMVNGGMRKNELANFIKKTLF